jgi:hypothetical protein
MMHVATRGNASGARPLNIAFLAQKASLFLSRPTLVNYAAAARICSPPRASFSMW